MASCTDWCKPALTKHQCAWCKCQGCAFCDAKSSLQPTPPQSRWHEPAAHKKSGKKKSPTASSLATAAIGAAPVTPGPKAAVTAMTQMAQGGRDGPSAAVKRAGDAGRAPRFEVDPSWPKRAKGRPLHVGDIGGVHVDTDDSVWIVQRYRGRFNEERLSPVLRFSAAGDVISGWGGTSPLYDWPEIEHGVFVDHNGSVWLCGGTKTADPTHVHDRMLLKFDRGGRFRLQIGRPMGSDRQVAGDVQFNRPTEVVVDPATDEAFVADGYGGRRVVVIDAVTGAFKRQWSFYGGEGNATDQQGFHVNNSMVHGIALSRDGMLYICFRDANRFQVFWPNGTFIAQRLMRDEIKGRPGERAGWDDIAFSPDHAQRFMYVAEGCGRTVRIFDRLTLSELGSFGGRGRSDEAGKFFGCAHSLATDSHGNLYVGETGVGVKPCRIQKFVLQRRGPRTHAPARRRLFSSRA